PSGIGEPTQADQLRIWRGYAERELRYRDHPVLAQALDWLEANDPGDDRIGLSWGDSRIGNVIWQDHRAAAILDWEACALVPTEADLGWWLMFDRMSFDDMGAPRMDGYPTREEMIAFYEAASGREVRQPHYWEVFGAMRFCAIFVRLGDRWVAAGLMPDEANPAIPNMVTASLAALLGIENPTPSIL
ncbi:MAG: phosphotransferase, partial [Acidimicrobiales bacterium]|nr:phosphotransferase [Acidimicrobiales bacterium]